MCLIGSGAGKGAGGNEIWDPLNISVSDEATLFKFGAHVDPGLFLPADQKLAPKMGVAWGTCPISKFRDPLNISVSDEATSLILTLSFILNSAVCLGQLMFLCFSFFFVLRVYFAMRV